jgi:hypothetical protein
MKLFYTIMLWLAELELTIARSTGRDPRHVAQLSEDATKWQGCLQRLEIQA